MACMFNASLNPTTTVTLPSRDPPSLLPYLPCPALPSLTLPYHHLPCPALP